ncbi:hypothetical protein CF336_g9548 [Tilletia laevis]|nr:hypothetical protein CF336_g9548 [Tilletia laevis]
MASVRMDMDELFAIHSVGKNEMLSSTTAISASIRIRYYDVYNTVRRLKLETARKDPDALKSLQLWADTFRQEGWEAEFLNDSTLSATPEPVWVCFLMPRWSKKEFSAPSSSVWCVDSTHNTGKGATRQEKIFLTTIIVRSASMGSGIPLAFLITPSETQ